MIERPNEASVVVVGTAKRREVSHQQDRKDEYAEAGNDRGYNVRRGPECCSSKQPGRKMKILVHEAAVNDATLPVTALAVVLGRFHCQMVDDIAAQCQAAPPVPAVGNGATTKGSRGGAGARADG